MFCLVMTVNHLRLLKQNALALMFPKGDSKRNYTLTFTIGDAYDKAVFSVLVARAFANLHLSGLATGGVAIGKFSAATQGNPLFECAFPIVLSGSKTYGPSSSMPANPVEGQLYFVVE